MDQARQDHPDRPGPRRHRWAPPRLVRLDAEATALGSDLPEDAGDGPSGAP